jgi:hypothetical protein
VCCILTLILFPTIARAQEIAPYVFHTTIPVDADIRGAVDAWLVYHNPSIGVYYAITYAKLTSGGDTIVCLASLDLASPEEHWNISEGANGETKLIWFGTVRVNSDLSVDLLTDAQQASHIMKLAMPSFAPGGSSAVRFPFQTGRHAMYGPAGVHVAGYSSYGGGGMSAVDLVGGSDFGAGGINDSVYASYLGTIDYVCTDDTSVMIHTDDSAGNEFIYAHLLDNASLEVGHEFGKSQVIGVLRHGGFDDDCGAASQQDNHWHVHWGFVPANSAYRVEGCVISTSSNTISCGTTKINPGGFIASIGGMHGEPGADDGSSSNPTFWDYLLVAFISIFDRGIIKLLPEHTSPTLLPMAVFNTIRFLLRTTYALLVSNFSIEPAAIAIFLALTFRALMGGLWLVGVIFRTIKMIPTL